MTTDCKGCHSESSPLGCHPKFKDKSDKCPCGTCLIKGVCVESCEEHEIFVGELRWKPVIARYIKRQYMKGK